VIASSRFELVLFGILWNGFGLVFPMFLNNMSVLVQLKKFHYIKEDSGLSLLFNSTSSSLFTGGTFSKNLNILHEYHMQQSLKLGGTNYLF
jgi:hypothetical protein